MNRNNQFIEAVAKTIYDTFDYDEEGEKPAWQERGNSLKQDEARRLAMRTIETIREAASHHCSADGRATFIWLGKQLEVEHD